MNTTLPQIIVPDAILTEFLVNDSENADRIYRAKALVEAGHVERTNFPGLWLVRSASVENGCYRVTNGLCHCPDATRVGAQNCKHAVSVRIFQQAERLDAEQSDPTPDACVRCGAPTSFTGLCTPCTEHIGVVPDPDAPIALELTGHAYLTLVPATALPSAEGGCTRLPMNARARELYRELYPDDDSAA